MFKAFVVKAETETPELYDTIYMCQNRANRKGRKVQLTSEGLSNKQPTTAKQNTLKKKKKKKKKVITRRKKNKNTHTHPHPHTHTHRHDKAKKSLHDLDLGGRC